MIRIFVCSGKSVLLDDPSGNIAHGCTGTGGGDVAYLRGGLVHRTVGLAHPPAMIIQLETVGIVKYPNIPMIKNMM